MNKKDSNTQVKHNRRLVKNKINKHLEKLEGFINEYSFNSRYSKCIFINSYNHLFSANLLANRGLKCQSFNCLRMGLESTWLGIYLNNHKALDIQWALGAPDEQIKKLIKDLETPPKLRDKLGNNGRIKVVDRNEIYSALSDKSHTKLSSIVVFTFDDTIECIPLGGLRGDFNIYKTLEAVCFVIEISMAEIEDSLNYQLLTDNWVYNRLNLICISQAASQSDNGILEPQISSKGFPGSDPIQWAAILELIRTKKIK
jgi:hypothetical protein